MNPLHNPTAIEVDNVLIYIFGISLLMLVGITATMIYFVIKYRRSKNPQPTSEAHSSFWLEATWTLLPTLIVMTMFWYGWVNYLGLRNVPKGAMEIGCTARQWSWQFKYPNGRTSSKLVVPVGKAIKVNLVTLDVLHSFFVPAFRIKRDVVPGMESYVWFEATAPGNYDILCAEYCGTGHAAMVSSVEALSPDEFERWYNPSQPATPTARGRQLLEEHGCLGCHSFDGSSKIAPVFGKLKGQKREITNEGLEREIVIDADYLRRSIREPQVDLVEGYAPIMPAFGKDELNDKDLDQIVQFLLNGEPAPAPGGSKLDGNKLMEENGCFGCHSTDGSRKVGPSFKGLKGRTVEVKRGDQEIELKIDAAYLKRSIKQPKYDVVDGYPAIMPAFDTLSDEEVDAIVKQLLKK